jgi:hypothetical protein
MSLGAGENWIMPTHFSGLGAVISEPNVVLSVTTKVFGLPSEPKANAMGNVPVVLAASS